MPLEFQNMTITLSALYSYGKNLKTLSPKEMAAQNLALFGSALLFTRDIREISFATSSLDMRNRWQRYNVLLMLFSSFCRGLKVGRMKVFPLTSRRIDVT